MRLGIESLGGVLSIVALIGACASSPAGGSGGVSGGTGGKASASGGSGGATGTGGAATGTGGVAPGTGGVAPGTGGVAPGTGGVAPGTGGVAPGTGGVMSGSGGSAGTPGGAGGVVTPVGGATGSTGVGGAGFGLAGPSRCATAGVALCEDFEKGLDSALWTTRKVGDAMVTVDDVHAARGSKALHISTAAGGTQNYGYITEKMSFPATNNTLYGRMFVWFEDALTTDGHFTLAEGTGTGNAAMIRFGGQNKFFGVGTDAGASGDWTDKDNKPIPTKTWICAEFEFKGDTHEFSVWWDDLERTALHRGPSNGHTGFVMPQFNSLWFGWWMYNMAEPQELWIDEIAVDFKPIGCSK